MSSAEKNPPRDQLSFEMMLGWFGRFTPQFKFKLMLIKRHVSLKEFDLRMKEIFRVHRAYMTSLVQIPKGPMRAKAVFLLMDEEAAATSKVDVTCHRGCSACCRTFPKQITDDEAALLARLVEDGEVEVDLNELERQALEVQEASVAKQMKASSQPCLFLGAEGECRVYANRPATCRKYHVTSDPAECETQEGKVTPQVDLVPETILSAAMSIPETRVDWMPLLIHEELLKARKANVKPAFISDRFSGRIEIVENDEAAPKTDAKAV